MSYEFTKLSEVPAVSEFPEGANAIIETNGEIKRCPSSGGGSVPKPLTYDYMPEGYPKKSVQTTTLMEEQELAFELIRGAYTATLTNALDIVVGKTYTVNWDGTEYESVGTAFNSKLILGNLSVMGTGNDTGEPFLYMYNPEQAAGIFGTLDTSATHTISVKTTEEIVTPMAEEFLPAGTGGVDICSFWTDDANHCNKTYREVCNMYEAATTGIFLSIYKFDASLFYASNIIDNRDLRVPNIEFVFKGAGGDTSTYRLYYLSDGTIQDTDPNGK